MTFSIVRPDILSKLSPRLYVSRQCSGACCTMYYRSIVHVKAIEALAGCLWGNTYYEMHESVWLISYVTFLGSTFRVDSNLWSIVKPCFAMEILRRMWWERPGNVTLGHLFPGSDSGPEKASDDGVWSCLVGHGDAENVSSRSIIHSSVSLASVASKCG